jgi:hypothetical protein
MAGTLAAEVLASKATKLRFHEWYEPLKGVLAAFAPGNKELRDLEWRVARQGRG